MTRRIKLTLEYNGTPFHGWQKQVNQPELPTVQAAVEEALAKITGEPTEIFVAGRTDVGVHATHQICHFDTESAHKLIKFKDGITHHTYPHIAVTKVEEVPEDFHARHSATMRHYRYSIFNRRTFSPIHHNRATLIRPPLNAEAMHQALQNFRGELDCASFRSSECQSSTSMVFVEKCAVERDDNFIHFTISGNHFLHNMVRILAGTLVEIGEGKKQPEDFQKILEAKDRTKAGKTLDACGLYLTGVDYPDHKIAESC